MVVHCMVGKASPAQKTRIMIRTNIRNWLHQRDLYLPLKYSRLFRWYQRIFKPGVIAAEKKEVAFYRSFLPQCRLIFDIGGYDGHKTAAFLHFAPRVVCVEPDAGSFAVLSARFRNHKVFLENAAVSHEPGTALLHVHVENSAFNTLSAKWRSLLEQDNLQKWSEKIAFTGERVVNTTTLDALIERYGTPDFIKIDVEGWEPQVLKGLSRRIAFLSFEALLPDGLAALEECFRLIRQLDPGAVFNIAAHEQLLLPDFVDQATLSAWLEANPVMHFEVIVQMHPGPNAAA